MNTSPCKVCGNEQGNTLHHVKEMQFGLREDFIYQLCGACGCMQLQNIPSDLSKYYPSDNYYSFHINIEPKEPTWKNKIRASYLLNHDYQFLGKLLTISFKEPPFFEWLRIPGVQFNDKVLDVGAGNGSLLVDIHQYGFQNLIGIDPFLPEEKDYGSIKILKKNIFQLNETFDYIMLHHSFEHMDEPHKVMAQLHSLLKPGKYLLIRIPVMGNYGWQTYGTDWVALDAPRHLLIYSEKSMRLLAQKHGFEIKKIVYDDEDAFSIWASEQYKKDIPLQDPKHSYAHNINVFTQEQMNAFRKLSANLKAKGQSDQAAFYLYKP